MVPWYGFVSQKIEVLIPHFRTLDLIHLSHWMHWTCWIHVILHCAMVWFLHIRSVLIPHRLWKNEFGFSIMTTIVCYHGGFLCTHSWIWIRVWSLALYDNSFIICHYRWVCYDFFSCIMFSQAKQKRRGQAYSDLSAISVEPIYSYYTENPFQEALSGLNMLQ